MALNVDNLIDKLVSHALTTGHFDRVNSHEPKNAPGSGLSCAIWLERVEVAKSGLNSSSARLEFSVRLYTSMIQEPQDSIDIEMLKALDSLFTAYIGDFEFGGEARMVDLRGSGGSGLAAQAGYINQDSKIYRVFTISVPVIVNDVWTETP